MEAVRARFREALGESRRLLHDPVLLVAVIGVFSLLFLFIIYPLFKVFLASLYTKEGFTLRYFSEFVRRAYHLRTLYHSLTVGVLVAIIGTFIAFIYAYALTRTDVPLKRFFRIAATAPIISPPFLLALAVILLLGHRGVITRALGIELEIYGLPGLVLTETLAYFPIAFLTLYGVLQGIDPAIEEAALNLGASKLRVFFTVTLPLAMPGIASALLLVFIRSMEDFGNPIVLQGSYTVLTVQAYLAVTGMYNMPLGSTLSVIMLIPTVLAFVLQKYWVSKRSYVTVTGRPSGAGLQSTERPIKYAFFGVLSFMTAIILLFYGVIFYGSFTKLWGVDNSLTLANYRYFFETGLEYLKDTLYIAGIATPIGGLLGMLIAYLVARKRFVGRGAMDFISMLNFAVPGTVVGIGYILAFNSPPLKLTGTALIIMLVFIFRRMPVGIQDGIAMLRQIDPAIEEASINLGAGFFRTFGRIILPLVAPALLAGLTYLFVRCMTAISAVVFVVSGKWQLLTVALLGEVDNAELAHAAAYGIMIIVIVLGVIGLMEFAVNRVLHRPAALLERR